jgi:hypothetical protein
MSLKNAVTPPGIDPRTVRLVTQRLNHYATPGPKTTLHAELIISLMSVAVHLAGSLGTTWALKMKEKRGQWNLKKYILLIDLLSAFRKDANF